MEQGVVTQSSVLAEAELLVFNSVISPESRRAYRRAIRELIDWLARKSETQLTKAAIHRYRSHLIARNLSSSTINQKLSAIRKLAVELGDNGIVAPATTAAIARVQGVRTRGVRTGHWLSHKQAEQLLDTPDTSSLKGKRDRALIAVLLGCGLRRTEIASLGFDHIQQRSGRWVLVNIRGKHGRVRSVPMPAWAKEIVDEWLGAAGINSGRIFRAVDKVGRIHGEGMSAQAVYEVITGYGIDMGVDIAPHDLRRSFARLAHSGKSPLEQIQLSLGHASVATTERYIGSRQDLLDAPCDRLGISLVKPATSDISSSNASR